MDQARDRVGTTALLGMAKLLVLLGLFVFLPAGTLAYPHGWIFLLVFFGCMLAITVYLLRKDPELLRRRLESGPRAEKRPRQKLIVVLAIASFFSFLVVPALDHRFAWSRVPLPVAAAGDLLIGVGFFLIFLVFRVNSYAAAAVAVGAEQKVVDTGPYAWARHPMYAGGFVLLTGTPLALGSFWGLLALVPFTVVIVSRLRDEESLLSAELPGYEVYRRKVRHRLIPGVW